MARSKPIDLGHRSFPSQKEAQAYFREMIANYQVEDEIKDDDEFFRDVGALIERHPERNQKVGRGIEAFIVRRDGNGNKMLWLRRMDGSETDFSYISCIRGEGNTLHGEFAEAARLAIRPDIVEFKSNYFNQNSDANGKAPCQETGKLISFGDAHVDHYPLTFKDLFQNFLAQTKLVPSREMLSVPQDNQTATTFVCAKTEKLFVDYHRQHATLMVVESTVNLRRKRK